MPTSGNNSRRTKVFIIYSHRDTAALERLQVHLKPLEPQGIVERWDDTKILASQDWEAEIKRALSEARVAILLVSADFLASSFITRDELPPILWAQEQEGLVVLRVILNPSLFTRTPILNRFQSVNPPSQPLLGLKEKEQDFIWMQLVNLIAGLLLVDGGYQGRPLTDLSPPASKESLIGADNIIEEGNSREYIEESSNDRIQFSLPKKFLRIFNAFSRQQTEPGKKNLLKTVNFTAYYPRTTFPSRKYSFLVYAHLPELQSDIDFDVQKFSTEIGDGVKSPRHSGSSIKLENDALISIVPECSEIQFDPPEITKKWDGRWTRFLFEFEIDQKLLGEVIIVRLSIQVAGIEISCIRNCAIEVRESKIFNGKENPFYSAKISNKTSTLYQRIFVSYSRRDSEVTEKYKLAQAALGNEVFIDVDSLRAGEDWRYALAKAIEKADIFQLFWSKYSASSKYCRYEWTYAIKLSCPVRPVYWDKPMPDPPSELSHVNFKYVPFRKKRWTSLLRHLERLICRK